MAIYFDMDGTMADFAAGVRAIGAPHEAPEARNTAKDDAMWDAIRRTPHFYRNLPEITAGADLFRLMAASGLAPEVLTAVPKPKRMIEGAAEDKIAWNLEHLGEGTVTHICYRADKIRRCRGPEDVLIDDHAVTIREWREAGGTGILFREGSPIELPPRLVMALKVGAADAVRNAAPPQPAERGL